MPHHTRPRWLLWTTLIVTLAYPLSCIPVNLLLNSIGNPEPVQGWSRAFYAPLKWIAEPHPDR